MVSPFSLSVWPVRDRYIDDYRIRDSQPPDAGVTNLNRRNLTHDPLNDIEHAKWTTR